MVEELQPRALLLANLFRDQLDRYGELDTIADRWAAVVERRAAGTQLVLNADDPLVADLGRKTEALYFGVEDDSVAHAELQHASDSKHCRNCGHAYVYEAAYMGHLGRYHCPHCGNRRPDPAVAAESVQLRGIRSAAFTLRTPQGTTRVELPLPGLYNVYNALGAAALCLSLGVELPTIAAGLGAVEPAFGRAETIDLGGRATSILLVKNPAGANEVLRTLALEGGELDLFGVLNDRIADGRDVSWVWDADWETVAPHVARMTCSGTRAAELALRMKYAGRADRAPARRRGARGGARPRARRAAAGPLYALPTYTALLELRELLSDRGAGPGVLAMSDVIWHDVECGAYAADLPLWRELASAEAGPVLDVGAGVGRVALELARARPRRDRPRPRSRAARRARRARARDAGLAVRTEVADAAGFELAGATFGLIVVPMQTIQLLPGRAARAAFLASARDHLARRRPRRAGAVGGARGVRGRPRRPAAARPRRARRLALPVLPGRDPAAAATSSCSSACARRSPRTAAPAPPATRSSSPRSAPAELEAEGAAAGLRAEPRRAHRPDRRPPRVHGGAAAWLTASCGSARCTRT